MTAAGSVPATINRAFPFIREGPRFMFHRFFSSCFPLLRVYSSFNFLLLRVYFTSIQRLFHPQTHRARLLVQNLYMAASVNPVWLFASPY